MGTKYVQGAYKIATDESEIPISISQGGESYDDCYAGLFFDRNNQIKLISYTGNENEGINILRGSYDEINAKSGLILADDNPSAGNSAGSVSLFNSQYNSIMLEQDNSLGYRENNKWRNRIGFDHKGRAYFDCFGLAPDNTFPSIHLQSSGQIKLRGGCIVNELNKIEYHTFLNVSSDAIEISARSSIFRLSDNIAYLSNDNIDIRSKSISINNFEINNILTYDTLFNGILTKGTSSKTINKYYSSSKFANHYKLKVIYLVLKNLITNITETIPIILNYKPEGSNATHELIVESYPYNFNYNNKQCIISCNIEQTSSYSNYETALTLNFDTGLDENTEVEVSAFL